MKQRKLVCNYVNYSLDCSWWTVWLICCRNQVSTSRSSDVYKAGPQLAQLLYIRRPFQVDPTWNLSSAAVLMDTHPLPGNSLKIVDGKTLTTIRNEIKPWSKRSNEFWKFYEIATKRKNQDCQKVTHKKGRVGVGVGVGVEVGRVESWGWGLGRT